MTSLALNLSIFALVLASICFSAPIFEKETNSTSTFLPTIQNLLRAFDEKDETFSALTATEETSDLSPKSSTESSQDFDNEAEKYREYRGFSELNTSESSMFVTEKSPLYTENDLHYDRLISSVRPNIQLTTEKVLLSPSQAEIKVVEQEVPSKSSTTPSTKTTMKMISPSSLKYLGRLEDQSEQPEDVQPTTKSARRVTKKPVQPEEEQPELEHQTQETVKDVDMKENNEIKGDYKFAQYDPKAFDLVATVGNVRMEYDENNQSVSGHPLEWSTMSSDVDQSTPVQKIKNLDQAKKSPVVEEEKSNH